MSDHPYGWLSLTPPLAALMLAILTRRIILALFMGVFLGAWLMARGNIVEAVASTFETHLWPTLIDEGKLRVFSFTLLMGAMVGVINRSGGMRGLVKLFSKWASTRRRGQMATWILGLLIFFDDYANTMLLGSTLRPLCDRLRISREKLAYLVDSTAAPVAGLALVSTWVAVEIDYVQEGINNLTTATDVNAFEIFVASIPYRFYVLAALFFVPLTAILGREFGPMLTAERNCVAGSAGKSSHSAAQFVDPTAPDENVAGSWFNAVLPILLTLSVVLWLIWATGWTAWDTVEHATNAVPRLRDIMGGSDSSLALQYGALAGLVLAALLARGQDLLSGEQIISAAGAGARVVLPAIMILWLAAAISRMTGNNSVDDEVATMAYQFQDHRLYTADYLQGALLGDGSSAANLATWLPTIVFLLAAVVAFCTGTSFGTMGILLPMVIPLAAQVLSTETGDFAVEHPVFLSSVGGVLAGAIFGDHCSPISDTTVLSSQSSGCDHLQHVWTQLPYALLVAVVTIVLGTIPLGWGMNPWLLLVLQCAALVGLLMLLGKPVELRNASDTKPQF